MSFIVVKPDSHWTTSSLLLQPSTPAKNFVIFQVLPTSRFAEDCFPYLVHLLLFKEILFKSSLFTTKSRFTVVKLQPIGM